MHQGPLECGLFVCWYMEDEVRQHLGQGWGAKGYPDAGTVTERLKVLLRQVEGQEKKMRALVHAAPALEAKAKEDKGKEAKEDNGNMDSEAADAKALDQGRIGEGRS